MIQDTGSCHPATFKVVFTRQGAGVEMWSYCVHILHTKQKSR